MELLIGDVFRNAARAVPERTAAVLGTHSITFSELERTANRMARTVHAYGLGPSDRVAVWASTQYELLPLFDALAKQCTVFAPMNPALSAEESVDTAADAQPGLLIVDDGRADA